MRRLTICLLVSFVACIAPAGCESDGFEAEEPTETLTPQPPESVPNLDPAVERYLDPSGTYPGPIQSGEPRPQR